MSPFVRFPDLSKPKLDVEGNFVVEIVATTFKRSKNNTLMMCTTFETVKSGRQITQYLPLSQCKNSLLHQTLRVILKDENLDKVDPETLLGLKCRINVFKNSAGYLDVKAIPFKKSTKKSDA